MRSSWRNERNAYGEVQSRRNPGGGSAQVNNPNEERDFFDERTEIKTHVLTCPHCHQDGDYALSWLVRRKRARMTGYADREREARFEKARSYMVRKDDMVACVNIRCRKRFEIAGLQSVAFLQEEAQGPVEDRAARIRAAFAGRGRG